MIGEAMQINSWWWRFFRDGSFTHLREREIEGLPAYEGLGTVRDFLELGVWSYNRADDTISITVLYRTGQMGVGGVKPLPDDDPGPGPYITRYNDYVPLDEWGNWTFDVEWRIFTYYRGDINSFRFWDGK